MKKWFKNSNQQHAYETLVRSGMSWRTALYKAKQLKR